MKAKPLIRLKNKICVVPAYVIRLCVNVCNKLKAYAWIDDVFSVGTFILFAFCGILIYSQIDLEIRIYKTEKQIREMMQLMKERNADNKDISEQPELEQKSAFGGTVTAQRETSADYFYYKPSGFSIRIDYLPQRACVRLARRKWDNSFTDVPYDYAVKACSNPNSGIILQFL